MKREDLYLALTDIDDSLIEEAARDIQRGKRRVRPWMLRLGALAACLCLLVLLPMVRLMTSPKGGSAGAKRHIFHEAVSDSVSSEEAAGGIVSEDAEDEADCPSPTEKETDYGLYNKEVYRPSGKVILHPEPPSVYGSKNESAPSLENEAFSLDSSVWDTCQALLSNEAQDDTTPASFCLRLMITVLRDGTAQDAQSGETLELLSLLRSEGYSVGLTEYDTPQGTQLAAAGYFTPEELSRLKETPPTDQGFGWGLSFGSEDFQREDTLLYLD